MIMVLGPTKKKAEAKAEQRRKRDEDAAGAPDADDAAGDGRTCRGDRRSPPWRPEAPAATASQAAEYRPAPAAPRPHVPPTERPTRRSAAMPKMKTHSGAKKRFRVTGRARSCASRPTVATCSRTSPRRRPARLADDVELAQADAKKVKKLLGK